MIPHLRSRMVHPTPGPPLAPIALMGAAARERVGTERVAGPVRGQQPRVAHGVESPAMGYPIARPNQAEHPNGVSTNRGPATAATASGIAGSSPLRLFVAIWPAGADPFRGKRTLNCRFG